MYSIAPLRDEIMDLDCLPFADYDGFNYGEVLGQKFIPTTVVDGVGVSLLTSRSCPYNCTFCFHSSGKKYRRRTLDNVFNELKSLISKYSFSYVQIIDELFGNDLAYVRDFCERIKPYGLKYWIQTRLDRLNNGVLDMLKESGCVTVSVGIEHVNDKVLKSMKKHTSVELIDPILSMMLKKGIRPVGNIIFGDVEETAETVAEALEWWVDRRSFNIQLVTLMVFPGSEIYKNARSRQIIKDPVQYLRDGCPIVNVSKMNESEWSQMKDKITKYRIIYENPKSEPDYARVSEALDSLANSQKNICVWPATHDTIRFFKNASTEFYNRVYFVNMDTDSQFLRTYSEFDCKIYEPGIIINENIEIVICPRSKLVSQIRSICERDYPSVKHVVSVPELETFSLEYGE